MARGARCEALGQAAGDGAVDVRQKVGFPIRTGRAERIEASARSEMKIGQEDVR